MSGWGLGLFTPRLHCALDKHKTNRQLHLTAHWSFCLHVRVTWGFSPYLLCLSRCIALYFRICSQLCDVLYFTVITSVTRSHENQTYYYEDNQYFLISYGIDFFSPIIQLGNLVTVSVILNVFRFSILKYFNNTFYFIFRFYTYSLTSYWVKMMIYLIESLKNIVKLYFYCSSCPVTVSTNHFWACSTFYAGLLLLRCFLICRPGSDRLISKPHLTLEQSIWWKSSLQNAMFPLTGKSHLSGMQEGMSWKPNMLCCVESFGICYCGNECVCSVWWRGSSWASRLLSLSHPLTNVLLRMRWQKQPLMALILYMLEIGGNELCWFKFFSPSSFAPTYISLRPSQHAS